MRTLILVLFVSMLITSTYAQQYDKKTAEAIEHDGRAIYTTIKALEISSAILRQQTANKPINIADKFCYTNGDTAVCIFLSNDKQPVALATIKLDKALSSATAITETQPRSLTAEEREFNILQTSARQQINIPSNNNDVHVIPIITANEKKVYALTITITEDTFTVGSDYMLQFDKNNRLISKRKLHDSAFSLSIPPRDPRPGYSMMSTRRSPKDDVYMTATEVYLMQMFKGRTNLTQYVVLSDKYISIWDFEKDELRIKVKN